MTEPGAPRGVSGPLRIAVATDRLLPSHDTDTEQLCHTATALARAGAQVIIIAPDRVAGRRRAGEAIAAHYGLTTPMTWRFLRAPAPSFRWLEKSTHAVRATSAGAGSGAHLLFSRNLPTLLWALRFTGLPVAWDHYRCWPDCVGALRPLLRWMGRHPRFLGAALHSAVAVDCYQRLGWPEDRLLVARNGHDPAVFEPRLSREEARRALGLSAPQTSWVVYSGHLHRGKGAEQILELAAHCPGAHFWLVGSLGQGPVEQAAARLANVTVAPWQPARQVALFLLAADVLIIPPTAGPLREGRTVLPMKTFLYLGAGRPILAPDLPDLREVLIHGENAWLVPPDRADAGAAALDYLLADRELADRLAAGAQRAGREYTWDRRAERVLEYLSQRMRVVGPHARLLKPI